MQSPTKNKKNFGESLRVLKSETGSALMIALFTVTLLIVIAMEILYESNVEFLISSQQVNRVKAFYAAKSGMELSLLRIHIYKKAMAAFGKSVPDPSLLEMIWTTPFAWPPPVPKDLNAVDKDSINQSVKNSAMKSSYTATIVSEGSKIDLNDLGSPSKRIRDATRKLMLQVFSSRIENDDESAFAKEYRDFNFEELVNNIADWVDSDEEAIEGGAENRFYEGFAGITMPPNRPFQSVQELHMVAGMDDQIYELLVPKVTTYGSKAVNVNHASKELLMALHETINSEVADKIIESRNDPQRGPFKDLNDFLGFITPLGVPQSAFIDEEEKPTLLLAFDPELNFRIQTIGLAGKVSRKITAIVFDYDQAKTALANAIRAEATPDENATPTPTPPPAGEATPTPAPGNQIKAPTDRPNVVYWLEE
jgi:general secretion pathway protein K